MLVNKTLCAIPGSLGVCYGIHRRLPSCKTVIFCTSLTFRWDPVMIRRLCSFEIYLTSEMDLKTKPGGNEGSGHIAFCTLLTYISSFCNSVLGFSSGIILYCANYPDLFILSSVMIGEAVKAQNHLK